MKRSMLVAFALFLFCAPAPLVWAQPVTAQLDPAATHVDFTLGDTLHTVHGSFRLKGGTFTFFDPNPGPFGTARVGKTLSSYFGIRANSRP